MKKVLTLACMILLSACGDNTPQCNSDDTIGLVAEIAQTKDPLISQWLSNKAISGVKVADIRTQEVNKAHHTSTCAASLNLIDSDTNQTSLTYPIIYTAQSTDDGKNIYVNINGLP
ncbi:hypothetical protein I5375_03645 [Citrobacter freundii]|nr:hypothetical protein [Citrobacter freundii]